MSGKPLYKLGSRSRGRRALPVQLKVRTLYLTPFLHRGLFRSALARWLASVHSPRDPWSSAEALRHTGPRRWTTVYVPGGGEVRIARAADAGWLAAMSSCALGSSLEPS